MDPPTKEERMKIIAHFMHESEMAAASAKMTNFQVTDSYLMAK